MDLHNIKHKNRHLVCFFLLSAFLFTGCNTNKKEKLAASKPNIIMILADDMSYFDISGLGQQCFSTPNLDNLISNGLFFNEAYAGSSECGPSRASLLTGRHMGHCRIRRNNSERGQDHLTARDVTIAEVLKQAGYTTGMVGKWGVGLPGTEGTPDKQGFDFSCGFYDQMRAHTYYPHYFIENGNVIPVPENYGFDMQNTYKHTRAPVGLHHYNEDGVLLPKGVKDPLKAVNSQDYIHGKAIKFITENSKNPFFLYYATQLPHGPVITPGLGEYKDKPWDQKHKEWAAMIAHLDRCVGEITETLKELGIEENTLIMFASDNGYAHWGYFGRKPYLDDPLFKNKGPWKAGKFIPLDGGVRVPFFVSWPGKIKPGKSDEVVVLYDIMATATELAGTSSSENDGKSLVPLFEGKELKSPLHDFLYWENGSHNRDAQSARFRNWFAYREHPSKPVQLWNVSQDVSCMNDVAAENKAVVDEAIAIFKREHTHSDWYIEPGESKESIQGKLQRIKDENGFQHEIRGNSKYPWELDLNKN